MNKKGMTALMAVFVVVGVFWGESNLALAKESKRQDRLTRERVLPNPKKSTIIIGGFRDFRTFDRWSERIDFRGGFREITHFRQENLPQKVSSEIHLEFTNKRRWNVIHGASIDEVNQVTDLFYRNQQDYDPRTMIALGKRFAAQTLILGDINHFDVERVVQVEHDRIKGETATASLKVNIFLIDLKTGITRDATRAEGEETSVALRGGVDILLRRTGVTYLEQLPGKAIQKMAKDAADYMAEIDNGPIDWKIDDPLEDVRGRLELGEELFLVNDDDRECLIVGHLNSIGETSWVGEFESIQGIRPGMRFEIYTSIDGVEDSPLGIFLIVRRVQDKQAVVMRLDSSRSEIPIRENPAEQLSAEGREEQDGEDKEEEMAEWVDRLADGQPGNWLVGTKPDRLPADHVALPVRFNCFFEGEDPRPLQCGQIVGFYHVNQLVGLAVVHAVHDDPASDKDSVDLSVLADQEPAIRQGLIKGGWRLRVPKTGGR